MVRLPDAEWRDNPHLKQVIQALSLDSDRPRIVGGAVRDSLLGFPVSDIDIATKLHPDIVMQRLEKSGIRSFATGLDHGTVTATAGGQNFEITTLRRDVSTDGRRATVAFSTDWKEDAARRDFTINALYADIATGEIVDYFGGLDDLQNREIRFIGDPATRIAEDHLRILRYFRFLARFGKNHANPEAIAACKASAKSLMALSRERIATELLKMLALPDPAFAVGLMIENAIFNSFLPEISPTAHDQLMQLIARERAYNAPISVVARLLAILPGNAETVEKIAMRLKLSNNMRGDLITRLADAQPKSATIRRPAYAYGGDAARDMALLYAGDADLPDCLQALQNWEIPKFPIKGGDLIQRGLRAGPVVARTLKDIEAAWIEEGFPDAARAQILTDQFVASALLSTKKA